MYKRLPVLLSRLYRVLYIALWGNEKYAKKMGAIIGERCRIFTKGFGSEPFLIEIGNNVTLSFNVTLITHDGAGELFKDESGRRYLYQKIKIGSNVFVGAGSIILPGVKIGDNVIIGAGSVVTKSIPSNCIVAGNPAAFIRSFSEHGEKVLEEYVKEKNLDLNKSYKERVELVAVSGNKQSIKIPSN